MPFTNPEIIGIILQNEGGFVDNAADRGGPTNFGITAATLGLYRKLSRPATRAEVQALQQQDAVAIYTQNYIAAPGFDGVTDTDLKLALVDTAVMHGQARAIAWLRQVLDLAATPKPVSKIDDTLLAKVNAAPALAPKFLCLRIRELAKLVAAKPSQLVFLAGWMNRVTAMLEKVL